MGKVWGTNKNKVWTRNSQQQGAMTSTGAERPKDMNRVIPVRELEPEKGQLERNRSQSTQPGSHPQSGGDTGGGGISIGPLSSPAFH